MKVIFASLLAYLSFSAGHAQVYGDYNNGYGRGGYGGGYGGGYTSPSRVCVAELQAANGNVIDIFQGIDCQDALRRCDSELRFRQSRGMNPRAICILARGSDSGSGHGGGYPRPQPPPYGGGNGGGHGGGGAVNEEWVQIDQVNFRDSKTAVAIANCKRAREADFRCNSTIDYKCGVCSEVSHSDHSAYIVYQLIRGRNPGHGGGGGPVRPRPTPPAPAPIERVYEQTFHFYNKKTAEARNQCERQRASMPQCSSPSYDCTPCTRESHTDHSQFDLYRLIRR